MGLHAVREKVRADQFVSTGTVSVHKFEVFRPQKCPGSVTLRTQKV